MLIEIEEFFDLIANGVFLLELRVSLQSLLENC